MTDAQWEVFSYQSVIGAAVLYFLAMLAYFVELAGLRAVAPDEEVGDRRTAVAGRLGLVLTVFAVVVHFVALVARGLAADPNRVPWGNMYEFTISGTFVVALVFLVATKVWGTEWLGPLVTTFVVAALMAGFLALDDAVLPLPDALNSYWLVIHVVSAVISTGAFTIGALLSVLYLVKSRSTSDRGYLARVPDLPKLDRLSYRMHAFGFPVWTFAVLITGPIWAHQAWGAYWNWDPKEVWAFITWVVYAAYLHARATAGWRGRNAAYLALVGVATLWFNFIGINFFSSSSQHSYAKSTGAEHSLVQRSAVVDVLATVEVAQEVRVVVRADHPRL
ncbi:c-type cytochrome biogenesis protein CcsB [Nocardioides hwasunensis]|uniref:C-type cytochrome biogenesis protein CcsB n=1 Tax=Nocardioides hwasunensis TaxID=397258 RepID=A0ABR8MJR7_9ACTN|nr:c-type cytochrome biogenesis protein CcsB [Nocardioides hwasunensis]MBD3915820.1 c-type cytochrome biogenesis protein CcsB [Nocardioides hwasunensis]